MKHFDVAVIGAGIAGSSVAFELAATRSVLLVDMEAVAGFHSTGRSAALFSANFATPSTYALAKDSLGFLLNPPPDFAAHPLVHPRRILWVSTPAQASALEMMERESREREYNVRVVTPDEVVRMCPVLRKDRMSSGLLELDGYDMDVNALHQGYLRGFRDRGGVLLLCAAIKGAVFSAGQWRVSVGDTEVSASCIVNSAGAWGDEVAAACGVAPIGLKAMRRTVATFDAPSSVHGQSWPFVYDIEERFYFKLEHSAILASPADETLQAPADAFVDDMDVAIGIDRIQQIADLHVSRIRGSWAGLRVFSPDRDLVVGYDSKVPQFFWLVGQGGVGIMTAPGAARAACRLIQEKPLQAEIVDLGVTARVLGPERFVSQLAA